MTTASDDEGGESQATADHKTTLKRRSIIGGMPQPINKDRSQPSIGKLSYNDNTTHHSLAAVNLTQDDIIFSDNDMHNNDEEISRRSQAGGAASVVGGGVAAVGNDVGSRRVSRISIVLPNDENIIKINKNNNDNNNNDELNDGIMLNKDNLMSMKNNKNNEKLETDEFVVINKDCNNNNSGNENMIENKEMEKETQQQENENNAQNNENNQSNNNNNDNINKDALLKEGKSENLSVLNSMNNLEELSKSNPDPSIEDDLSLVMCDKTPEPMINDNANNNLTFDIYDNNDMQKKIEEPSVLLFFLCVFF